MNKNVKMTNPMKVITGPKLTHFSKRIHFFMPLIIRICKIRNLCSFFVIIKIKYNKSACTIWQ